MARVVTIVEGYGEVASVPILIRRIAERIDPECYVDLPRPIRVKRQLIVKEGEFERAIELAARQSGTDGRILVLLDADNDCPANLAATLIQRATAARSDRPIRVVLAKVEYEAWFLAAAASIAGHRDLDPATVAPPDPEAVGDAKGWLSARMPHGRGYRETLDQPAFTKIFDVDAARSAPSFKKLWRDVASLL
ncbi:MAG: hypothetical protein DCC71_21615 [Proteobacteria bacterium]|nr:MAG: hypothetical protein DCC71_21615 [Pseudomonadota bacterium]